MKKVAPAVIALAVLVVAVWWWADDEAMPRQRPATVVNTLLPRTAQLDAEIHAVGTAQARASVLLTSEVDARLVKVYVQEGDQVTRGQKLVALDDRVARAQLTRAEAQLKDAQAAWERAQQLQNAELLSPAEADTLEANLLAARADRDAAAANVADHAITAPFSGVIGLRRVNVGSYVKAGDVLSTLDDLDNLEVLFAVPEQHLGQLQAGQAVAVRSRSYPERVFNGEVARIDTRVDSVNRTVSLKAALDNRERLLRPGQFLDVALQTGSRDAVMVPEQAILTEGSASFLYTVTDAVATRVEVRTGSRQKGWVEITAGLAADQSVVINGHARLGPGGPVEVREDPEALLPATAEAFRGN